MKFRPLLAALAVFAIGLALWNLHRATDGTSVTHVNVGTTPATIYRPVPARPAPVVLIGHGFAGSQQLMQSFALAFARNGYIAVTFDFPGHGRNPQPLTGSITEASGATRVLVEATTRMAAYARSLGDGRLAVLGHSMASDIVVRFAEADPQVLATIAVSMFSPVVTATSPRNLLVIVGDWEGPLKTEALRAVELAITPVPAQAGVTYGDFAAGTARRAAFSADSEHVSVLFKRASLREALAWLDQSFGTVRVGPLRLDSRGLWILALFAAVVVLARALASLLPRVVTPALGAGLNWRRLWLPLLLPMVTVPLLLRVLPTHFLPVLVADYLAAHFALYGLVTALCLLWSRRQDLKRVSAVVSKPAFVAATVAVIGFGFLGLIWPLNSYFTSFFPGPERIVLILAMLAGMLLYFISDEWLTRGEGAARGAYIVSKGAFLVSLAIAIALDFERLFFLIIIVPVIVIFFLVYGLFSAWSYRSTGHPLVAAIANAVAFAWAIGVTFPLLAR